MDTTLTDRYIQAVTRTLPETQRADVAAELRASIADQIDARAGEPGAERAVLTALGDPDALAAGYADRPLHLIGPRYYLLWWRLLKLLWWIVPACALFGVALGTTLSGAELGEIVGTTASVTLSAFVQVAFWTTLVFAVIERTTRTGVEVAAWTPDQLPELRESGAKTSDLVASLVFLGLLAGAIVWDLTIGLVYLRGQWLSFLNPQAWPVVICAILAVIVLEAILAVVVYRTGRWTVPLATANTVLATVSAGILLMALWQGMLVNPAVVEIAIDSGASADLGQIVGVVVGFAIVGVAGWDIIDGFLKARRSMG